MELYRNDLRFVKQRLGSSPARFASLSARVASALLCCALFSACSQQSIKPLQEPTLQTADSEVTANSSGMIRNLQQQLTQDPNNPEVHYKLGFAYNSAAEQLKSAEPEKSATQRKLAIAEFRKVLELVPGNEATLTALYNIYYDDIVKGKDQSLTQAKTIFTQLSPGAREALNPPSLALFLQRYIAQKESANKQPEELLDALLSATREQPTNDKAYIQLAKMYRTMGLYPLALATLKQAETNQVQSRDFFQTLAETYEERAEASGCSYELNKSLSSAAGYYQKAMPMGADKAELHYQLAQMFIDTNHHQLALNEIAIVLEIAPSAENYAWAAQTYSTIGKNQQAFNLLEKAKQQGLTASDTAFHEIYMNAGDWQKAAVTFTEYLQAQREISIYDAIKADIIHDQTDWDFSKIARGKKMAVRNEWEGAVYAYWINKINRQQLQQAATNRCELTEYYFYSGYRDYRAGKTSAARQHFSAALQQYTYRFIERPLASLFLARN